jgi:hypothetical protein
MGLQVHFLAFPNSAIVLHYFEDKSIKDIDK